MTGSNMNYQIDQDATLRAMAWVAIREWIASDEFETTAPWEKVWATTSIAKEIEERQKEHWQWWKGDDGRGEMLREMKKEIPRIWKEEGWVRYEQWKQGRPRRADHPTGTMKRAMSAYRDGIQRSVSDKTYQWAQSILGESLTDNMPRVITINEQIHQDIIEQIGPDIIEGMTREEIATAVQLPATYINRMVRWMMHTGEWEEVREQREGKRERRMRRVPK